MNPPATPTTLITGVNGFVGQHLARELGARGHRVIGLGHDVGAVDPGPLAEYIQADLRRPLSALPAYDGAVHLAGLSAVGPSFTDPQGYLDANGAIGLNFLAWHREHAVGVRAVVVSSGAVYAPVADPVDEEAPIANTSPYVVSKLLVENLADYFVRRGANVVVARPFNHIGPGQRRGFLIPDLVAGIQKSQETGIPPKFGDLSTRRDYTDVRDVVTAYLTLLTQPVLAHRTYNICSGKSVAGTELLAKVCSALDVEPVELTVDAACLRPAENRTIVGSNRRLHADTGWVPQIPLEVSLADIIAVLT